MADEFRKLRIPTNVVRQMSKKSRFSGPFDKQHGKWDQRVLKSWGHHFNHILLITVNAIKFEKASVSDRQKSKDCFFNTLTAGHKYSPLNRDILTQPI